MWPTFKFLFFSQSLFPSSFLPHPQPCISTLAILCCLCVKNLENFATFKDSMQERTLNNSRLHYSLFSGAKRRERKPFPKHLGGGRGRKWFWRCLRTPWTFAAIHLSLHLKKAVINWLMWILVGVCRIIHELIVFWLWGMCVLPFCGFL